jgi:archaellum component FlaC
LEQKVTGTYEKIPQATQNKEIATTKKIDRIEQEIDQYHKESNNLREHLTPTTPPTVKEQRKHETTTHLQEIEQQVSKAADLFDKAAVKP